MDPWPQPWRKPLEQDRMKKKMTGAVPAGKAIESDEE
jgi:hypothetical protein